MEEVTYMVCVRVGDIEEPVEGSTTTACVECGCDIWLSPASRKKMNEVGAFQVCEPCATRLAEEDNETLAPPSFKDLTPGQMGEVRDHLMKVAQERGFYNWIRVLDGSEEDRFEQLKATAEMAGEAMEGPDNDWGSMVSVIDYEGRDLPPVPLTTMIKDGVPKEIIAKQVLPAMVMAAQAERVIIGLCPHADEVISEEEGILDVLILMDLTADGVQRAVMAPITRPENEKPELGAWVDLDHTMIDNGMFVDALIATLQFVRTTRDA